MSTPGRRQYLRIKKQYPDAILLYRMGDFYETFDDDARTVARELEIALTSREMGRGERVPLAGIPYHSLESYLARLIKKGYKVAICEQVSDPATSKGLLDREVARVVTPGTIIESSLLDAKVNNYLASLAVEGEQGGLAHVDITTGEFAVAQLSLQQLLMELGRLEPSELLLPEGQELPSLEIQPATVSLDSYVFDLEYARETLVNHFGVATLEAFGCEELPLAVRSAGAIVEYLGRTHKTLLKHITSLHTYSSSAYMTLDPQTRRNLELFQGARRGSTADSLLNLLDRTRTPMGGRLLRRWLGQPLLDPALINRRLDAVAWFHRSTLRRERIVAVLAHISDLERLVNRARGGSAAPRDLVSLGKSLGELPRLRSLLQEDEDSASIRWLMEEIGECQDTAVLINRAMEESPAPSSKDGGVIKEGFSPELDEIRRASKNARDYIAGLERRERARTGIRSLKVGYNRVFGYYIEVSKPNLSQVPQEYSRRQTLVNGERFITPELKEYESLILNAQDRIGELETSLFRQVCQQVADASGPILGTAQAIAQLDAFCSLAEVASHHGYVRPQLTEDDAIVIERGRHPVVERSLPPGAFVPNDTHLSNRDQQLIILTGPNMAGKSTYIRQVALIVLMAQVGSFVPAQSASIGLVDRIFTRVGLQDDLALGHSTFMVEMVETATIVNHATPRSLIILDEIGRGTSTYDGISIARAVAEHIHNSPRLGCKTLFATHYHELTDLAQVLPRVKNYNVAVGEEGGQVIFLHRIVPGGADRSYGVQVAQLAGLPRPVISRAWEVLRELENGDRRFPAARTRGKGVRDKPLPQQLPLLGPTLHTIEELLALDVSSMTPLEAINKLYELQQKAREAN